MPREFSWLPERGFSLKPIHIFGQGLFWFDAVQHAHSTSIPDQNAESGGSVANEKHSRYS